MLGCGHWQSATDDEHEDAADLGGDHTLTLTWGAVPALAPVANYDVRYRRAA